MNELIYLVKERQQKELPITWTIFLAFQVLSQLNISTQKIIKIIIYRTGQPPLPVHN